jgi:2-polyprenyl-3-methyl-5-hydroxy-6-metoxy-1,4-benzoquinol methylase
VDSAAWDARYAAQELVWSAEPNRFVVEELSDLPPGRALDVAAGEGRNAIWLASRGWRVTAVDFSRVAVEKGRRIAAQRGVEVEWVVADVRTYRPPAGGFDAVLVAYLHLAPDELASVLRTAAAAVAPGGTMLVVGHDRSNLTEGVGGPQDPELLYTVEGVVAALPGLRVVRAERARRPVPGEPRDALDTVVRAVRPAVPA